MSSNEGKPRRIKPRAPLDQLPLEGQHIGTSHGCLAVDYDKAHKIFMEFHNPEKSNGHLVYNYIPVCDPKRKDQSTEDKLDPEVEKFMKDCAEKQRQEIEAIDRKIRGIDILASWYGIVIVPMLVNRLGYDIPINLYDVDEYTCDIAEHIYKDDLPQVKVHNKE